MHIQNNLESKISMLVAIFIFFIGLGIGATDTDLKYWISSTWFATYAEWFIIIILSLINYPHMQFTYLYRNNSLTILLSLLWIVVVLASYLLSPFYSWNNPLALIRLTEILTHFSLFWVLYLTMSHFKINIKLIYFAIILSTFINMLHYILFHYFDAYAQLHIPIDVNIRRLGYQAMVTIAFSVGLLFSPLRTDKYIASISIIVMFAFVLCLGGRASMVGILLILIVFLLLLRYIHTLHLTLLFFSGLLLLGLSLVYIINLDICTFSRAIERTADATTLNSMSSSRLELWFFVFENLDHYWLLGTGPQSLFFYPDRNITIIHAHNFLIQFLEEWGILGTLLICALLVIALISGFHKHFGTIKKGMYTFNPHFASFLAFASLTVTALFGGVYFFIQPSIYLILALVIWTSPNKR